MRDPKCIEFAFLGCVFDNPSERIAEALDAGARIEWFSDITCKLAWASIESLRKKRTLDKIKPLVIITEAQRLAASKKSPYYGQKIDTNFIDEAKRFRDSAEDGEETTIAAYSPILQDAAIGRQLDMAMSVSKTAGNYSSNAARMAALAKHIQNIQKDESLESDINVTELLENMQASYDRGYEEFSVKHNYSFVPGIPFPWDSMSRLTEGLNPGLHIIAARPSVGKTSFVLQCMNYWCDLGYKVAFDCLDMSVTEMVKRPVANLSWVSPKRMKFGWASPEEQYRTREASKIVDDWYKMGLLTLTLETDVDRLKSWAEIRHAAGKLDILVIDFAQKFRIPGKTSEYEIVTYASGVLKQLANECLIPVVLLSQLSRDNVKDPNGKRPPELSDLRGSGALEQDATSVVLMHKVSDVNSVWRGDPPMQYVKETNDPRLNNDCARSIAAVNWNLAKNQNGSTGELPFVVFQNCFRWYIGDEDGEKADMYRKIQADWRFSEEPFVTAERNGAVVYPENWPSRCAEMCGKLGLEIPSNIKDQMEKWDFSRYEALLKEHNERVEGAIAANAAPLHEDTTPPPSMASIASSSGETHVVDDLREKTINVSAALNESFDNHTPDDEEEPDEPMLEDEFEDDDNF